MRLAGSNTFTKENQTDQQTGLGSLNHHTLSLTAAKVGSGEQGLIQPDAGPGSKYFDQRNLTPLPAMNQVLGLQVNNPFLLAPPPGGSTVEQRMVGLGLQPSFLSGSPCQVQQDNGHFIRAGSGEKPVTAQEFPFLQMHSLVQSHPNQINAQPHQVSTFQECQLPQHMMHNFPPLILLPSSQTTDPRLVIPTPQTRQHFSQANAVSHDSATSIKLAVSARMPDFLGPPLVPTGEHAHSIMGGRRWTGLQQPLKIETEPSVSKHCFKRVRSDETATGSNHSVPVIPARPRSISASTPVPKSEPAHSNKRGRQGADAKVENEQSVSKVKHAFKRVCSDKTDSHTGGGSNGTEGYPKSEYKGLSWHRRDSKWMVRFWSFGKVKHLGCFEHEALAALIFDLQALRVFGEQTALRKKKLNFRTEQERLVVAKQILKEIGSDSSNLPSLFRSYVEVNRLV